MNGERNLTNHRLSLMSTSLILSAINPTVPISIPGRLWNTPPFITTYAPNSFGFALPNNINRASIIPILLVTF